MSNRLLFFIGAALLAAVLAVGVAFAVTPDRTGRPNDPGANVTLATVDSSGGLCLVAGTHSGVVCRDRAVITSETVTVTVDGRIVSRPLTADEREQLLAAIAEFEPDALQSFTDTCPTAYDGVESVYTFHGFDGRFGSCRWDLAEVRAAAVVSAIVAKS